MNFNIFFKKNRLDNIFHLSAHKAGSQWIKNILMDPLVEKKTGLKRFAYQKDLPGGVDSRKITERFFDRPFPINKIVTPLYMSQDCYHKFEKPERYKSIYVFRDPRDLLISYYYSSVYTHFPTPGNIKIRKDKDYFELDKGLMKMVDFLEEIGFWEGLRSWTKKNDDPQLMKVAYEDLIGKDSNAHFRKMFNHLLLNLSEKEFIHLMTKYSFKNMSGRNKGENNERSHLRKGVEGDWKRYFNSKLELKFYDVTKNTVSLLGYQ